MRTETWRSPMRTVAYASITPRFGYTPRPVIEEQVAGAVVRVEVAAVVRVAVTRVHVPHRERRLVDRVLVERDRHSGLLRLGQRDESGACEATRAQLSGAAGRGEASSSRDSVDERVERRRRVAAERLDAEDRLGDLVVPRLEEDEQRRRLAGRGSHDRLEHRAVAVDVRHHAHEVERPRAARRTRRRRRPRGAPGGVPSSVYGELHDRAASGVEAPAASGPRRERSAESTAYASVICAVRTVRSPASAASSALSGMVLADEPQVGGPDLGPRRSALDPEHVARGWSSPRGHRRTVGRGRAHPGTCRMSPSAPTPSTRREELRMTDLADRLAAIVTPAARARRRRDQRRLRPRRGADRRRRCRRRTSCGPARPPRSPALLQVANEHRHARHRPRQRHRALGRVHADAGLDRRLVRAHEPRPRDRHREPRRGRRSRA